MNVFEVSARFMRRKQVREYEPSESEVSLKAQLVEGENVESAVISLMTTARDSVLQTLGLTPVPTTTPPTPRSTPAPVATPPAASTPVAAVAPTPAATPPTPAPAATEKPSSGRGRPRLSDEEKAARAAAKAKAAASASDIPDDSPTAPPAAATTATASDIPDETAPAVPTTPTATASDIPDDVPSTGTKPAAGSLTSRDMANIVQKSLVKKYIQSADVKTIMAELDVTRLGDIPAEKLVPFYDKISALPGMVGKLQGAELV